MRDFGTKSAQSSGPDGQFDASEANNELDELMNTVEKSGQTLGGTNTQLSKAMANHVGAADFYTAVGTNSYELTPISSGSVDFTGPTLYFEGMRVRTFIANANTGTVTVDVNDLGVKSVFNKGVEVTEDTVTGNCEMIYSVSDDRFNLTDSGIDAENAGVITSITAGTNLNKTGPAANPVLNLDAVITGTSINGVTLSTTDGATKFLNGQGAYVVPSAAPPTLSVTTTEFTSPGVFNYVVDTNFTVLRIICVGGGGAGGGADIFSSGDFTVGGGGGSGGYCEDTFDVTPGQSYTITVGAGGSGVVGDVGNDGTDSSVFLSASEKLTSTGGKSGRISNINNTIGAVISGGLGGSSTVDGGINNVITGASGEPGVSINRGNRLISGNGGSNGLGAGGLGVFIGEIAEGKPGGIGAGGSGGKVEGFNNSVAGGKGGDGAIIIIAYKAD